MCDGKCCENCGRSCPLLHVREGCEPEPDMLLVSCSRWWQPDGTPQPVPRTGYCREWAPQGDA